VSLPAPVTFFSFLKEQKQPSWIYEYRQKAHEYKGKARVPMRVEPVETYFSLLILKKTSLSTCYGGSKIIERQEKKFIMLY
jgi:hypothetical protein